MQEEDELRRKQRKEDLKNKKVEFKLMSFQERDIKKLFDRERSMSELFNKYIDEKMVLFRALKLPESTKEKIFTQMQKEE